MNDKIKDIYYQKILMHKKRLVIQFNEANFDLIRKYCDKFDLVFLKKILHLNEIKTSSESKYEHLEPWIQWYSFYTGLSFQEHKTFNLGDCLKKDHKNFVDNHAKENKKVTSFSAMNLKPSDHFNTYIPDPWTESEPIGSSIDKLVSSNLKNIVNENASLSLTPKDILGLLFLVGVPTSYKDIRVLLGSLISFIKKDRSSLAAQFDYFITKYSLGRSKKEGSDLSLIFLNGLAHVQHHYFLNSEFVSGKNPSWYSKGEDDIYKALKIYDQVFSMIFKYSRINNCEIWIITGLTQKEYPEPFCYWRFKDHKSLISNFIDTEFEIFPRMTRDFEIKTSKKNISLFKDFLENSTIFDKDKNYSNAFTNINLTSDETIFASFAHNATSKRVSLNYNNKSVNLENELNFIALKNAGHISTGWAYTNKDIDDIYKHSHIPIWDLNKIVMGN